MQQTRVSGYTPRYPKKLLRGAALTAAALLSISGAACTLRTGGEPMLTGDVAIDEPAPAETPDASIANSTVDPDLSGEPMADEGEEPKGRTRGGEPALLGKIAVPDETENP